MVKRWELMDMRLNEDIEWLNPEKVNLENRAKVVLYSKHKKAYDFAKDYCKNKKVLEIGCGAAYGTKIISKLSYYTVGMDSDISAVKFASEPDSPRNLHFLCGNPLSGFPFCDNNFDVVIFFQVIEHISPKNVQSFLPEIKRVAKPGGKIFITTPNKALRLSPLRKPWNKYHKKEYNYNELTSVLNSNFEKFGIYGITAKREILDIKKRRVKQNPFNIYLKKPLISVPRKVIEKKYFEKLQKLKKTIIPKHDRNIKNDLSKPGNLNKKYSIDDFILTEEEINKSMDFLAVCEG